MANSESRLKKATYSVALLALYQITVFVCNLILPRFILVAYGSEYNGIISSITQFLNFISILRLGVAGATRVELYKSLATNNTKKTSSIIRATEIFMRKVARVFILYLTAIAIFYPFIINSTYSWIEIASLTIIIGAGTFAQYFFGITYSTLLQADQKLYIYNILQIVATISNTVLACLLINLGCSIQVVKLGSAVVFTISPLVLNRYVTKYYNLDKSQEPDNTALKYRGDAAAHSIANIIHENTDIVVLALLTDVKIVSVYTVYNLVMNGLKQLMTVFTLGLESAFGDMWVKNEIDKMYKNLNAFEYLIFTFVSIVFSCAAVLILPFVRIYTAGVTDVEYIVPSYAALAVLAQAFYCIRLPYITIVQAAGHYKETKNGAFIEAIINITLSVVLTIPFGMIGVVIGTLSANVFRTVQYAYYSSKHLLPRRLSIVVKKIVWTLLNGNVSIILYYAIMSLFGFCIENWLDWVIGGIICGGLSVMVWLISSIIFYRKDLRQGIELAKRIVFIK